MQNRKVKSIKIFHRKDEWYLNYVFSGLHKSAQILEKGEKKFKVTGTTKMIGCGNYYIRNNITCSHTRSNKKHDPNKL